VSAGRRRNVSADRLIGVSALAKVFVLAGSLLLGACADGDAGKNSGPVIFGTAGGGNGGGGATSEMRFSW
jgi:hypothetical protein